MKANYEISTVIVVPIFPTIDIIPNAKVYSLEVCKVRQLDSESLAVIATARNLPCIFRSDLKCCLLMV